jgi:para-aminobenzoate synthetase component I
MLNWANRFNICAFLDTHQYHSTSFQCLLAAGSMAQVKAQAGTAFDTLSAFFKQHQDWIFGHFGYDLKNETELLTSSLPDGTGFDDLFFFVPEVIMKISGSELLIGVSDDSHRQIYDDLIKSEGELPGDTGNRQTDHSLPVIHTRFTKEEYLETIVRLKQHILHGDCYEINFCQEFYAYTDIAPLEFYKSLSIDTPNPFSAFYRNDDRYALCFSPERYIRKKGQRIISQPIKGTAPRDLMNHDTDERNRLLLSSSGKERAENIMVVDLVRNDLSKVCEEGSVQVDELCAVYAFPQVFQMISTISGSLPPETDWTEAIRQTFPMGSMTGVPKRRVMELIEQYERTKRGLFSGAIGYVTADGDFDFNVVIRTVLYNASTRYLSFQTGSAITFNSDPESEYAECMLKASAIKKGIGRSQYLSLVNTNRT